MERARNPGGTRGWVVGRAAGAPVIVSPGWLLAAVALTFLFEPTVRSFAPDVGAGAYLVAAAFVLLLLGSVFLHELAHALVARRCGVVVRELAVTLLGGHTRFGAAAPTPGASALVAIAGPVANLALGVLAWAGTTALPPGSLVTLVVAAAALANGFVGAFNLVPGLPLDGGRVLEAAVWRVTGSRARGTVAAGWVGRLVAVGVLAWVLLRPLAEGRSPDLFAVVWGALVGAFLWTGAASAVRAARSEQMVEALSVSGLMTPAVAVAADRMLGDLGRPAGPPPDVVLLAPDGRPAAYLDVAAVDAVPPEQRDTTPLSAVAVPLRAGAVVRGDLSGPQAVQAVAAVTRHSPVMAVVDSEGEVVGLLRAQDVISALRGPGSTHRPAT